ncbi:acyl-CoA dehydrogenase family protein [Caballeronia sp. LZ001]|uniref:acyl-CoA dehydrogenase family protein n=1 Tax=Caballeronia sp. LZ001 TaxID=3038553 RepID=UPI00285A324F|nr:acyl-CoA dehydrogenase family protein [Caballeronia sp. LZ001]MDR5804871.1 acyl-CoA dehydrogenase family protein [Caballeronia sp. LZ001]
MTYSFELPPRSAKLDSLREEVREFLKKNLSGIPMPMRAHSWHGFDAEFSRKVGERGWIGMTWPKKYGGQDRTMLERYVVLEEMVAAGAPVNAHWTGDRQSGHLLLRYGTEQQKESILPKVARGEAFFCIGMSEPDAGSDLANIRTRATPTPGGWTVNGTKIWTSGAHQKHYMIMLARTRPAGDDRHAGMSQFLVDLSRPGIEIRPIRNMAGELHFNEVVFTDCFLPDDCLLGTEGEGWKQVMSELSFERSGPERFLTAQVLLREFLRVAGEQPSHEVAAAIGSLVSQLATLRRMSFSVASALQANREVGTIASIVKDLGSVFEQSIPDTVRQALPMEEIDDDEFQGVFRYVMLASSSFSIYGGTREILRSIIGKSLQAA